MYMLERPHEIAGDLTVSIWLNGRRRISSEPDEDIVVRTLALEAPIAIHTVINHLC